MEKLNLNKEQTREFLHNKGYYELEDGDSFHCVKCEQNENIHNDSGWYEDVYETSEGFIVCLFHCDDCNSVTFAISKEN